MTSRGMRPADAAAFLTLVAVLVAGKVAEPDTDCRDCWQAEASFIANARDQFGMSQTGAQARIGSFSTIISIAMGGTEPSWYERHRDDWARTGDEKHLKRMLRHVR